MAKKYQKVERHPCPFCSKKDSTKSHERFCSKNPTRVKAGSSVSKTESAPQIVVQQDPVKEADLPDFEPENSTPEQPKPKQSPSQPGAPAVDPMLAPLLLTLKPAIGLLCGQFDKGIRAGTPGALPKPPELPGPISEDEKTAMTEAYGQLLLKYGAFLAPWMVEMNAVLVTAIVFVPRILQSRAFYKHKAALAKAAVTPGQFSAPNVQPMDGSAEALKDAYARAVASGVAPS